MTREHEPSVLRVARSTGGPTQVARFDLGRRVRELRKARSWTLEKAAQQAGLARSTLSKIENDQMSPTFELMRKLAEGLGIDVPQLFTPSQSSQSGGRMDVTRMGDGQAHLTSTYDHELLNTNLVRKAMLPYRAHIRARNFEDFDGWVRHDGEEFLYVLTGSIHLFTEFYEPVHMVRGDSAYYDAAMGHNVVSTSAEDALILWVTSMV
ncbi:MAG: XRE family transcriptional regulator [Pseudomonadota bacterium]